MKAQSGVMIEIIGLELLYKADITDLIQQLEEMSFSGESCDDDDTFAKDSIQLEKVTAGARRRTQYRRNSMDSYANDSVEITRKTLKSKLVHEQKDELPAVMVFEPLKSDSTVDDSKDLPSTQLGAKDLTKLKPHSLTNRAA